jgi:serine protease Do
MRSTDLFDHYLKGELNEQEKQEFETRLAGDPVFSEAFRKHKTIISALQQHDEREQIRNKMKQIHSEEFGSEARILPLEKDNFARRYGRTVMVAASTALIAVLSTVAILSAGGYLLIQNNKGLQELEKKVDDLKYSQDAIVEGIIVGAENIKSKVKYAPANYEGSAFAYNNNGYVVTSYHVVHGADSVFLQNTGMERTAAKVVITDPKLDLAVLKLQDENAYKSWQLPFSLTEKSADIGEKIFTLGFPRKDMVYGEGSLSSLSGYSNDTCMYQISIPVNPGNSGGPILDENGNVIGVIRGKISDAEATGFAVKSSEILHSVNKLGGDTIQAGGKKSALKNLKRTEQIRKINPYVFNVLVYKN